MEAKKLHEYDDWIADHLDELVMQYAGKVVAIDEGKILLVGDSEVEVYRELRGFCGRRAFRTLRSVTKRGSYPLCQ